MNDLISRQAAIEALTENKEMINAVLDSLTLDYNTRRNQEQRRGQINEDIETIKALPSAQPEQRWIPCSERLPDAEDCPMDCMVTRRSKYVGNYTDMAVAEADGTWTHENWKAITIKGKATCISTRDADIIAWMPLPEPYREDGEKP
jgi:hypothetical protein